MSDGTLYPIGYGTTVGTLDDLRRRYAGKMHPEYARRVFAMLEAAGGLVGIGGGWRSNAQQAANYARAPKTFAPPGSSFHETQRFASGIDGYVALDLVGADTDEDGTRESVEHRAAWDWVGANAHRFGLVDFSDVNSEPWHVQPSDIPRSVREWKEAGRPDPGDFVLPVEQYVPVVDISRWQGAADFEKLAATGVVGVIARAGNGKLEGPDPRFAEYVDGALAAGLTVGAYYWLRPFAGDPAGQAAAFLAEVGDREVSFLMLDIEWNDEEIGPAATAEFVGEFAKWLRLGETVEGRVHVGYSSAAYWNANVGDDLLAYLFDWIVPAYVRGDEVPPSNPDEWLGWATASRKRPSPPRNARGWAGWQFSSSLAGPDFGFESARLDGNLVRSNSWERWTGERVESAPPAPPAPPAPIPAPAPPAPPTESEDIVVNVKLSKLSTKSGKTLVVQIKKWQGLVNAVTGRGLAVDGDFGPKTDEATKDFQRFFALEVDGIVGPKTWSTMLELK